MSQGDTDGEAEQRILGRVFLLLGHGPGCGCFRSGGVETLLLDPLLGPLLPGGHGVGGWRGLELAEHPPRHRHRLHALRLGRVPLNVVAVVDVEVVVVVVFVLHVHPHVVHVDPLPAAGARLAHLHDPGVGVGVGMVRVEVRMLEVVRVGDSVVVGVGSRGLVKTEGVQSWLLNNLIKLDIFIILIMGGVCGWKVERRGHLVLLLLGGGGGEHVDGDLPRPVHLLLLTLGTLEDGLLDQVGDEVTEHSALGGGHLLAGFRWLGWRRRWGRGRE